MKADGQVEASRNMQIAMAAVDCTGMCLLASFAMTTPEGGEAFLNAVNAKLGTQLGPDDILPGGAVVNAFQSVFGG